MFSKLIMSLVMTIGLLSSNAFAQTATAKKVEVKKSKTTVASEAKQDEMAKSEEESAKKSDNTVAAEAKALEEKRVEEARIAAEKANQKEPSGFLNYVKSKFSASYHGEFYFTRRAYFDQALVDAGRSVSKDNIKLQDFKILHNPTIIYRPFQNIKLLVTSEFKYTDALNRGTYINRHYRSLILLTRENVLTEKEDGLKLDLGLGRRVFDRNHGAAGSYGNSRINATMSKKYSEKLSTSLFAQYLANDPVHRRVAPTTWKHSIELIPSFTFQITENLSYFFNDDFILNTPWNVDTHSKLDFSHEMNIGVVSYKFNDKNSAYFQFKYLHSSSAPFQKSNPANDWFEYYIGYTYSVTPKFTITPEVGSEIFRAKDKRDFFAEKVKWPEFAVYIDYSL